MFESQIASLNAIIAGLDRVALATVSDASMISGQDHFTFQNTQALAYASGVIGEDVAQWLYAHLTRSSAGFNSQPIAVRIVIMRALVTIERQMTVKGQGPCKGPRAIGS